MNISGWPAKLAVTGLVAAGVSLTGCSEVETAVNRGGDTPCSDFVGQDAHDQRVTVTKFLNENNKEGTEPAGVVVDGTIVAVNLLCGVQGNADVPIRKADLAGVFAPPAGK